MNLNKLIKKTAGKVCEMWIKLSEDETLSAWDKARIISEETDCVLEKLPETEWEINNDIKLLGDTNGKVIRIRSMENVKEYFTFFHEVGHVLFHYRLVRKPKPNQKDKELEADMFALRVCLQLWPDEEKDIKISSRCNAGRRPIFVIGVYTDYERVSNKDVYPGAFLYFKEGPDIGYCKLTPVYVKEKIGRTVIVCLEYSPKEILTLTMTDLVKNK